jgi:hypothetical protein
MVRKNIDPIKAKEKALKGERLTADERRAIIRDYMLEFPRVKRYGYNKAIMQEFYKNFEIKVAEKVVSEDIKFIQEEWKNIKEVLYTKTKIIEMLERLAERPIKEELKLNIIREIGKIEGIVKDNVDLHTGITDLSEDDLRELKAALKKNKD